jgi:hypothetical protein
MASTIDWSLHLLDEPELLMFMMLGALSSPAPLSIVEATVHDPRIADPVGVLGRLIDRSLVRRTLGADGSPRFGMLELLHERSFELLESRGESEVVRLRHAEAVAVTLDELREHHWRHPGAATSELIAEMLPEARAAFAFATTHEQWELAGRIVGALTVHRHRDGGQAEARAWLDMLLPHLDALSDRTRGAVLFDEGFNCWHLGDLDRAREAWADAVDAYERLGDTVWLAYALACLSMTHVELDDDGRRRGAELAAQAIERARSVDVPAFLATVLIVCGEFARSIDDYQAARRRYEEAGRIAETVGDRTVHSVAIANLSYVASHEGNFTEARRLGRLGLELAVGAGRRVLAAWSVSELAEPALGLGELQLGARLVGAAEAALERMGGRIYPGDTPAHERVVAGLIAALGREEYDRCYAAGATLTFDQSVDVALGRQAPSDTQLS